nr:MAG TPA: hypothetical protein [Caudoviricetes sp.]
MIDDSCEVPREDLDDGFNPCRKQVVENGELCQYAHMYDVMNERYDREEDTSYLNSVKRDRINQSTPKQTADGGKLYAQDAHGVEGFVKSSGTLDPTTNAEIPSSKAVADYAPIPLPISKGGTGGNTPYVTDDLDSSAIFVMHDAPNDRYDAAPMSALTGYLDTQYLQVNSIPIPPNSDLNEYKTPGKYAVEGNIVVPSIINTPINLTKAFNIYVFPVLTESYYIGQQLTTYDGSGTYYRFYSSSTEQWRPWALLYPTPSSTIPNPLPVRMGGTGGNTPYVTDDLDSSANFVMYDEQNARYNAAPMTSLMRYLNNRYSALVPANNLSSGSDLDGLVYGTYYTSNADASNSLVNIPNHTFQSSVRVEQFANGAVTDTKAQVISENSTGTTFYRSAVNGVWNPWNQLYPTPAPTVPDKFSYAVSPFPADDWEGEMNINVAPVFTATIGSVTYVVARVYGSKKFNYTGTADNINLFSSLKPVGDYTSIFSGSTDIPLTLSVSGRSYTAGTYGLTPNVSGSNLSLNNQIVSSMINLGRFNISTNLKCVFGEGTNTPGVTVSVNCMALMWHSVS